MKNPIELLIFFIKGIFMGAIDIIPGVSGGTIALITGIYERLVHSISSIDFKFIPLFFKGRFGEGWENIKGIDFRLFIPLGAGIGLAIVLMANVMGYLLNEHTAVTFAFFFGLILGSAILLYKDVHPFSLTTLLFSAIGFIIAFFLARATRVSLGHSLVITFGAGAIAIIAMILPGISGSFLLLLLGQYDHLLNAVKRFNWLTLFAFAFGALIGLLGFSKLLDIILKKWETYTIYFLIGLMLGALYLPYANITATMVKLWPVVAAGIAGLGVTFLLYLGAERFQPKSS